jgi:hypothetical protein
VDPRVGLDDMEKRKFLHLPELELRSVGRSAHSQCLYTDYAIPALLPTVLGLRKWEQEERDRESVCEIVVRAAI